MALNRVYRSEGGNISMDSLLIDHKAFPFKDDSTIPMTVKESRYEVVPTVSALPVTNWISKYAPGGPPVPAVYKNTSLSFDWQIKGVSDGSLYDLNNSYFLLTLSVENRRTYCVGSATICI